MLCWFGFGVAARRMSSADRVSGQVYDTTDVPPEESDTIAGLAEKLGLDPNELEKTVKEFNAAVNDKEFDLMKLDGKATVGLSPNKTNWANKIDSPPYYGFPMT